MHLRKEVAGEAELKINERIFINPEPALGWTIPGDLGLEPEDLNGVKLY